MLLSLSMWGTQEPSFCTFRMVCSCLTTAVWPVHVSFGMDVHELTRSNGHYQSPITIKTVGRCSCRTASS